MERLVHVEPALRHEQQAREFVSEFRNNNSELHGTGGLENYTDDYKGWLKKIEANRMRPITSEKVPSFTFFLVRQTDSRIVGMINIRPFLNETLLKIGGTIGYCIRPSERRKGYNKYNLMLGIRFCANCGVESVYIDCDATNVASARTAEALGGKLVGEFYDDLMFHCNVQKYVINSSDAISKFSRMYY